jgi:methylenetetrahydrofolate dehydrogenase (NADP+)/methenyltetrahydrofolate cyclohydrolase
MTAVVINGNAVAQDVRAEVADDVAAWVREGNPTPALATVLIGEDPASKIYVGRKQAACAEVGIKTFDHRLAGDTAQDEAEQLLNELREGDEVSGILLQLPTPPQLDSQRLVDLIPPEKDVDGLTSLSVGYLVQGRAGLRPCTPLGVMELLHRHKIPIGGREAVVVGRSELVGRPMVPLLLAENATVTVCHSRTTDLASVCRRGDILIAAVGQPNLIRGDWVKDGAAVIDVGINREDQGGLVGDVEFPAAAERARWITPVPGGVGPMTIAMLLRNTLTAAKMQAVRVAGGN